MVQQQHSFTHHGWTFTIEADGWPGELKAAAAIIDLQLWAMSLDPIQTASLHDALTDEREAMVYGIEYDQEQEPLPAVREAQRRAVQSGLAGTKPEPGQPPTVTIEAYQVAQT